MYSLVNVATLVRDLARHQRAAEVATELLRAFALDDVALDSLETAAYDATVAAGRRTEVLAADRDRPRALQVLAAARGFADDIGIDAYAAAVDVLEVTPLGGLAELQTFVRTDVLAGCWQTSGDLAVARRPQALDIVTDGILGTYAGDDALAGPWRQWLAFQPVAPAPTAWSRVVNAVAALPHDAEIPPAPSQWAERMHEACWAVHLTGRERDAAIAQLHALVALVGVWAPERPPLRAVSMTTAAVHAEVVADVLDGETRAAMSQPLFRLVP
ncbi:MAG TPA: hypothetical protein VKJ07_25120 [Mycobacteriales bacterium]|nr:hypothetical protein [Mycobacteriales bacterium]